jgi:hemoglobin/transferrin/lactoferrin receptor protein
MNIYVQRRVHVAPAIRRFLLLFIIYFSMVYAADAGIPGGIQGVVVDPLDAPVAGAVIALLNAQGTTLQEAVSDAQGNFSIKSLAPGSYALRVQAPHFATRHIPITSETPGTEPMRIRLELAGINSEVTVTAMRGNVGNALNAAQFVTIRERDYLLRQPLATIGSALESTPGIMVQETTYGQSSPHLRGLTGYQTLLLVDGVRFNTSIFRSGPNQYLSFINPSQVERVEAMLGPASSMYGSDSMGGTINLLTAAPSFQPQQGGSGFHGELTGMGASTDASGVTDGRIFFGSKHISWLAGGTFRRLNNLRGGAGEDSRNAFHRYLGLPATGVSSLLGSRMLDTGFSQAGADAKLAWDLPKGQSLILQYLYSGIKGERSYRDQLGGLGRLRSSFYPQQVNFGYARYEKQRLSFLDSLTGTFSINSQSDGSVKQNLKFTDVTQTDDSRVDSYGYGMQGTTHSGRRNVLVFGGEVYDERITSTRFSYDPVQLTTIQQRALYPNGSRYVTTGLFVQGTSEIIPRKVRTVVGMRYTNVRLKTYAGQNLDASGKPLGVADSLSAFDDVTFNTAVSWQIQSHLSANVMIGRGFRAPNVTDLASLGLTTLGYDMPSYESIAVGALMGTDSSDGALSTGKKIQKLGPESLYNYELGLAYGVSRFYARVQGFDFELMNPIAGRTLLFPVDSAPSSIGGISVTPIAQTAAQKLQDVVAVATSLSPRSMKSTVNDGHSKYYGVDSYFRFTVSSQWKVEGNYSFMAGRDLYPNRAARRLPPQQGNLAARFTPAKRFWLEIKNRFAGAQNRLNAGDLDDDRIGASRSRTDMANFFRSGNASPYIQVGLDGRLGTSDDVFAPTGETLRQIQDGVLPIGAKINGVTVVGDSTKVPLYLKTAGWYALDILGAISVGERTTLHFGVGNIFDASYRIHGSGVDSAGANLYLGFRYRF